MASHPSEILDTVMDPIGMEYPDFLGFDANLPATCDTMEIESTIFTVDSRIPISSAGHESTTMEHTSSLSKNEMSYQDKTDLAKKIASLGNKSILRGILGIVSQEEPNLLIQEHEEWTFELDKLQAPTLEKIKFYVDQMEQQTLLESVAISCKHLAAASPAAADTEDLMHHRSPRGSGNSSPRSCSSDMDTEQSTRKRKNYLRKSAEDLRSDFPKKIKQEPVSADFECESAISTCHKDSKSGSSSPRSKKGFTVKVTIIDTRAAKDEEGVFHCPECEMTFSDSSNMNKHLRTHTAEKPFVCEDCGKAFTHSNTLKDHMNIHQKKKPYVCPYDECSKSFSNGSNLNRHLRVHTGEKPYVCTHCDKQFSQSSNMKVHLRTHFK